jgi:glycosyltransferase involved in cell wall biosynthesis
MRVTHVITRLIVGGAQENTIASVLGLRKLPGLEVDLISGPSPGPEGTLESEFAAHPGALQILPHLVRPIHPWCDALAYQALTNLFRRTRPTIVHTHSGKAGILGRLAAARAGVPCIVHTIHGPSFGPFQGPLPNWLFRTAELRASRVTNHFVTVAHAMRDQYLAAGIGRPDQYTRIFSGFPLEPFLNSTDDPALRARYGIAPDDLVIGKIARLFKLKGHDDLFAIAPQLLAAHPKIKFLIVGDGEWRGRFEQMARDSGFPQHLLFTGLIPPAAIPAHVGIMDLLVHLSTREGLPRALPQALAAGKPVVAYDCDGAGEICRDGQTGFLVRPGHLQLLAERVLLLAQTASLRAELGQTGRRFVRENFAVEKMVEALHALYQRLGPVGDHPALDRG